jgi:enamine deaminase RidA (YjgF/YER057c/UK114 family)
MSSVEDRLADLGIALAETAAPVANYVLARRSGNLLYVSGHLGKRDGKLVRGKVGAEVSRDDAYQLARGAAIDIIATVRAELQSLDRVRQVVKLTGFVNSAPDFTEQSSVINGASDLLVEAFGERGKHARSSVGMAQLPLGAAVEVEAVFEVE